MSLTRGTFYRVMTGDERYQAIFQKERGVHSMCDVAERLEKMGMEKGIEKGLDDPTGKSDSEFLKTIEAIAKNVRERKRPFG